MTLPLGYNVGCGIEGIEGLPNDSVHLVLTDPPYKEYQSNRAKIKAPKIKRWDRLTREAFCCHAFRVLKPGCHLYSFCDISTYHEITECLKVYGFKILTPIYWIKNNHGSGDLHHSWSNKVELIVHAANTGDKIRGLVRNPTTGKKRPENVLYAPKTPKLKHGHGTIKPISLLMDLILASTYENEIILDPFAGAGSTLIAARKLQRFAIGFEIDPQWESEYKKRVS